MRKVYLAALVCTQWACSSSDVLCNKDVSQPVLGSLSVEQPLVGADAGTSLIVQAPVGSIDCVAGSSPMTFVCSVLAVGIVGRIDLHFLTMTPGNTQFGVRLRVGTDLEVTHADWTATTALGTVISASVTSPANNISVIRGAPEDAASSVSAALHGEICSGTNTLFISRTDATFH